jgi:ribose 5-phosphate isomerase B
MNISIAADHAGLKLKNQITELFFNSDYLFNDIGTYNTKPCDYPIFAQLVVNDILNSVSEFGILICGSGIGMSIVSNKYCGIRAALCHDELSAQLAREHNNANILCLGSRFIKEDKVYNIVKTFLDSQFSFEERHQKRVNIMNKLGEKI